MSEQVYYKVVSVCSAVKLLSCVTRSVRYVPGWRAKSPFGPLFVFGALDAAQAFVLSCGRTRDPLQIWECEVGNPRPIKVVLANMRTDSRIANFWANPGSHGLPVTPAPAGTVVADWVKLTRKVS